MNLPPITVENVYEKIIQVQLQEEITSSLSSMSYKDGETLLDGVFDSCIKSDGHGLLSHIRSRMQVLQLARYD